MKKHIPNLITGMNVLCGALSIMMAFYGELLLAVIFILGGMIFDFFDGMVARMLHVKSDMGKELDSLADIVTFGVAPGILAHLLIRMNMMPIEFSELSLFQIVLLFSPVLIPVFSAFRLAKFNLDTRQTTSFIGMPVPAHALFWVGVVLTLLYNSEMYFKLFNTWTIVACVVILSLLLVSELPMFSLKISGWGWKENSVRYIYFALLIIIALLFKSTVLLCIIPLYILVCVIKYLLNR